MNGAIKTSLVIIIVLLIWLFRCGPTCGDEVMIWDGEFKKRPRGYHIPIMQLRADSSIVFHDGGEIVGALEWSGGTVVFHGNIDDSAMIFFEFLFDHYMVIGCPKEPQTAPTWGVSDDSNPNEVGR